jgi:hypothetical protein
MSPFDTLSVDVRHHGGFAAIICRYIPGRQTCDEPIRQIPPSELTVTPAGPVDVESGSFVEVSATFTAPASTWIRDVEFGVRPPIGWSSQGGALTRSFLAPGESLQGRWTVRLDGNGGIGNIDLPIAAELRLPGDAAGTPRVHVEQAVKTIVLPPAPTGTPFYLGRNCQRFTADIGLDDETTQTGSVTFKVLGDGGVLHDSGVIRSKGPARSISVGVSGVHILSLQVTDGGDGKNFDHADWANARLSCDES